MIEIKVRNRNSIVLIGTEEFDVLKRNTNFTIKLKKQHYNCYKKKAN